VYFDIKKRCTDVWDILYIFGSLNLYEIGYYTKIIVSARGGGQNAGNSNRR